MKTVMTNKQWAAKYPQVGTGPVAAETCVSPAYFERERELIFRRAWVNVGRVDEVERPGQYFVRELAVCRTSIIVMRGKDGVVRGFHNVCSHRGNKLVWHERGTCGGGLSCGFHSWTFDTQGKLAWVPDEENFFDLKKGELGLTPVHTDVWEGFIFVHLDPNPKETLIDYLGGVAKQLTGTPFGQMSRLRTYKVEERANWKVGLDAQNEIYHLPFQHRYTFPDSLVMKDNTYARLCNVNLYNHHSVWSCEYNPGHKMAPVEALLNRLDSSNDPIKFPHMIGDFDFFVIFPNMVILLFTGPGSDFFMTYNFWPLAVDRSIWEIRFHYPKAENAAQRLAQEYSMLRLRDTLMEDAIAHESVQTGLTTRAKTQLWFQDDEITIRYFHKVVEEFAGAPALVA